MGSLTFNVVGDEVAKAFPGAGVPPLTAFIGGASIEFMVWEYRITVSIISATRATTVRLWHQAEGSRKVTELKWEVTDLVELQDALGKARAHLMGIAAAIMNACGVPK